MIRSLQDGDLQQWSALWTEYLAFDGSVLDAAVHARTWSRLLDESEPMHGALAIADGEAVGLVHYVFHRSTWTLWDSCYLQDLFVISAARGKGHGKALIDHVHTAANAAGTPSVYWQTQADNAAAIALYEGVAERSGYVQFRTRAID